MAYHSERKLSVLAGTLDALDGWNLRRCWAKEDEAWSCMVAENKDYPFPNLGQSVYLEERTVGLNRALICQDAFWAHDGTSFVTVNDDYGIRQYLVPVQDPGGGSIKELIPFTRAFTNQSVVCSRVHPRYSLFNETDDLNFILLGMRNVPLQLCPLRSESDKLQISRSFDVSCSNNDTLKVPHAIDFHGSDLFLAGFERNRVCLYDINRSSPIWATQSTRKSSGSHAHRAIVSCFDESTSGMLFKSSMRVYGTYKNELSVVDPRTPSSFHLHKLTSGKGIIQILKSVNGHYLYIITRNTNVIDILDIRQPSRRLNVLTLPFKMGTQKFKASLSAVSGLHMGTTDGSLLNWPADLVEFGGNDKNSIESSEQLKLEPDLLAWDSDSPYSKSRINIVRESPIEPGLLFMSYSPNKFGEPSPTARSGVALAYCPTV